MANHKLNKHSNDKWVETKHEFDVIDGKRVLKNVTEEKKISEWYNSGIFLWFLGALFLTFIPWGWSGYKSYEEKSDRIEKLDNEMANRLNQMVELISRGVDSTNYSNNFSNTEIHKNDSIDTKLILFTFKEIPSDTYNPKFYSSYKEFEDNSTVSLLYELLGLESDNKQKDSLKRVITLLTTNKLIPFNALISVNDKDKFIKNLHDSLYLSRWEK